MHRTVKLPYVPVDARFGDVLAEFRRLQSRAIRTAYCRLSEGMALRDVYAALRAHPVGQGLHTWLLLSGISKARALHELRPDGRVVFGGRRALIERSQGKLTADEWKGRRLWPLAIEGHARSFGTQGGNHLVTLDMANKRLVIHGPDKTDYELKLKLSGRSHSYRRRLFALQERCETLRDTPFSVSISDCEVRISWNVRITVQRSPKPGRILSLDLNPNRIGWTVVEEAGAQGCRCMAWGVFEYPGLSSRTKLASDDPRSKALTNKRRNELSLIAKELSTLARHYRAAAVVTERLSMGAKDHGKGRRFNRLLNQCWFKAGLLQPLLRRLDEAGLAHAEVNPAFSSQIGNKFWADSMDFPDPACAALELGRRYLRPLIFTQDTRNCPPKPNDGRQRKDGRRAAERSAALGGWSRVWRQLNPMARDTPRQARRRLREPLRFGLPRRPSVREQRSRVLRFDPRPGASDVFGCDFNLLLAD
jgi:IS605 OrfB family transposase